jgi:MFS transporter, MFS domain-containing protein family, molybdate-anion transporter
MLPYGAVFAAVVAMTALVHGLCSVRPKAQLHATNAPAPFVGFQANYLVAYLLAVAADWLQGPYVYALYTHYGYSKAEVGQLYIAGFASSAVFGTFVAAIADKYGRKSNAVFYCVAYILSCATKHSPNFYVLLTGRLLGGVAYSILFSAFESWMVYEHTARGFPQHLLSSTFAKAQLCNGIIAIVSGKVAGWFADRYGKVMPFDMSIVVLIFLGVLIAQTWTENYGDRTKSLSGGFAGAWSALASDRKILLLGLIQASFEGAMYTFIFVWTPALQSAHDLTPGTITPEIPHGTIFSTFMAATMIGSTLFELLERSFRVELIMRAVFVAGAVLFALTFVSSRIEVVYAAFVCFELLCGIYYPGMSTMRAPYLPEESRAALLTFFRVPLNIIVVFALYEDLKLRSVFALCTVLIATAGVCQHILLRMTAEPKQHPSKIDPEVAEEIPSTE